MDGVSFLIGAVLFGGGLGLGLLFRLMQHRRLLRLEYATADLEHALLSEKKKRAVETRWRSVEQDTDLLRQIAKSGEKPEGRYANDPL